MSTKDKDKCKRYLGAAETSFKERYNNRTRDFKHKKYVKCSELSKYIPQLKNQCNAPIVNWRSGKRVNS